MGDLPLRTPRHRRLGGPLPRQLANVPHAHPSPINLSSPGDASRRVYAVLDEISLDYFRFGTCYLYFVFSLFNELRHTQELPPLFF